MENIDNLSLKLMLMENAPVVRIQPIKRIDEKDDEDQDNSMFTEPSIIDVEFEELRSFPEKYTIKTYNDKGDVVVAEYSPNFINIKA